MLVDSVKNAVIGASGFVATGVVDQVAVVTPFDFSTPIQAVVQIIIGIATIIGIFKKSPSNK